MKRATLILAALALLFGGVRPAKAGFLASTYDPTTTFQDGLGSTTMTLAYDGSHYWSSSGGGSSGVRYAEYNSAGTLISTFSPGLDFRSVFTDASGTVFARQWADSIIYQQTSPGTFGNSGVHLATNSLDNQSAVVFNGNKTEYDAMASGTVSRWNLAGNSLGTVQLIGFGSLSGEGGYPQSRGIAADGNYWLTYNGSGILSAWDFSGHRVGTTTLNGAGTSFDSNFSFSYANGQVFIVDQAGGTWRGYDVGFNSPPPPPAAVPEPSSLTLLALGMAGLTCYRWRRRSRGQSALQHQRGC